jgi:four helix bundle protein
VNKKAYDLKERTFKFARRIIEIVEVFPNKPQCEILRKQLLKAGTSIGANIEEADGTITRKDFVNKMTIARKEAKEAHYWLWAGSSGWLPPFPRLRVPGSGSPEGMTVS